MSEKTVLIADDHPIFRQGLRSILDQHTGLRVVGEAESGDALLARLADVRPDIVLLDLAMPGMDGLAALETALARFRGLRVVIVTSYSEPAYLEKAMELGARGYVLKDDAGAGLLTCIDTVLAGGTWVSPVLGKRAPKLPVATNGGDRPLESLTPMECRVLALVGQFMTSKEIAGRLGISYRTVQNHRANIGRKLDLKGIHQLTSFANQHQQALDAFLAGH